MTIADAFDRFLDTRRVYCSDATVEGYAENCGRFFRYLENTYGKDMQQLDFKDIPEDDNIFAGFIIYLRNKPRKVRNTTIRSYCRSIKVFLRFCYDEDYCKDYLKKVRLPKDDAAPKMVLFQDEVAKLDATFDRDTILGLRNYCIVHLMLDCGMRCQEVLHLQVHEILRERNVIQILDTKGFKSRMTLIPDFLIADIDRYLSMCGRSCGIIFHSVRRSEPMTQNAIKMLFQELKQTSGVNRVHAHLLRHTFATSYLIGGGNLEFLRVFLGHTDYTVTKNYAQLAAQFKMLGAEVYRLDAIFFTRGY